MLSAIRTIALSLTLGLLAAPVAQAAPVYFDFTGTRANNAFGIASGHLATDNFTVSSKGVDLTITGLSDTTDGSLHRNSKNGLGVSNGTQRNKVGAGEQLTFTLEAGVVATLSSIVLQEGGRGGQAELFVDGVFAQDVLWDVGRNTHVRHDLEANWTGSRFELRGDVRGFRVVSATYHASVPEPGTFLLMLVGALGLVVRTKAS